MVELLPALVLGFLGNLHCLGMCGPIALAVPHISKSQTGILVDDIIYNSGRIITYALLGLIIGVFGSPIGMSHLQGPVSIAMGSVLLVYLIIPGKYKIQFLNFNVTGKIWTVLRNKFGSIMNAKTRKTLFLIGLLNGLLPCGLVYIALFAAAGYFDPIKSMMFMTLFGVGTSPIMFSVYYLKRMITAKLKGKVKYVVPAGVTLVAIMLILRGLSLGIPYISPELPDRFGDTEIHCH